MLANNKGNGLCNTCTRWAHIGDPCIQKYLCKCGVGNQHHTTLCTEALAKSLKSSLNSDLITGKFTAFEPATPDHDTGVYSMTARAQRAVALQTAVLSAENKEAADVPL